MTKINRGSEWRKWDLHIHSPYTVIDGNGSYKDVTDDDFIKKLCEEKISVVGLTNYFKFSEEDYKLANKLRDNGISTFMNLEFRLTNINDDERLSDYHVIFSDKLSKTEIDNFLSNLDITVGSCKKKINSLTDKEIKTNAAISFEELLRTLQNESLHLNGKYLTAFLSRGHGNSVCGRGRGYTVYEEIVRKSDLIVHSTDFKETLENDRLYWLGKTPHKNKYIKPLLQSSDAHCLEDIGVKVRPVEEKNKDKYGVYEKDGNYFIKVPTFTWIKSAPTFEGLKQIIYEPEERIVYGTSNPDNKSDYMVLDYIEYYDAERTYFNRGLNAIIGGRSTGKATLLNSIAKYQKSKNFNQDNHYTLEDGNYRIVWGDGNSDVERPVEFIPQEFMIDISKDKTLLNKLLGEIIAKKNMDTEERAYKEIIESINRDITALLNEYFVQLSNKKSLIKPEGDREAANTLIATICKKIERIRLENQFSEDDNNNYEKSCKLRNSLLEEIESLKNEEKRLKAIKDFDFSVNIELSDLSLVNRSLIIEELNRIKEDSTQRWIALVNRIMCEVKELIDVKSKEIENIEKSSIYSRGKGLEAKNEELKQLEFQLEIHKKVVKGLDDYTNECSKIEKILGEKYETILDKFAEYFKAIQRFSKDFKIEEKDLKIEIKVSTITFEDKIKYLNARNSNNNAFINKFDSSVKAFAEDSFRHIIKDWLIDGKLSFNKNKSVEDLFKDIFTTNWYSYDYTITYQNDEFQDMSQGKKSFVILKLLLEFSDDKKPVLIDQPEDSLDNRAIYHELRKYLLDTKKNRQIIVVTHNPNVVVGADAENIIVAHQQSNMEKNKNGKKFQYINGSLEDTSIHDESCQFILESQGIREHIFDVLEGGKEAFEKREQKYNYTNYKS